MADKKTSVQQAKSEIKEKKPYEGQEHADFIKSRHQELRVLTQKYDGDFDKAWKDYWFVG